MEEKDQKIADLEAKLAEKERSIEMLNQHLTDKAIEIERLGEELAENKKESDNYVMSAIERYADLTNRLAEKEHTISTLIEDSKVSKEFLKQQLAEKEKEIKLLNAMVSTLPAHDEELEDIHNQAKTDFVIEQLEKVKELCIKDITICEDYFAIEKILDQQIKELKEGK